MLGTVKKVSSGGVKSASFTSDSFVRGTVLGTSRPYSKLAHGVGADADQFA